MKCWLVCIRVVRIWLKTEREWPYIVNTDMTSSMLVDESYWTGGVNADAENYPVTATSILDRFVNFILNEVAREANTELFIMNGCIILVGRLIV